MNELSVSLQHSILTLADGKRSQRDIAKLLGIHRETVARYLRLAGAKPAKVPIGLFPRLRSQCEPWRDWIESGVAAGLTAQRIYQDLVNEHQYVGGYDAVKRFVRQLRETQPEAFVRIEVEPGMEAQVDFGQGAWIWVNGRRKRPHLFRVVLSHSRKGIQRSGVAPNH